MILCCLPPIARYSFQRMGQEFFRKELFRFFDGLWKFYSRKTITEPKCFFGGHINRVIYALQRQRNFSESPPPVGLSQAFGDA